MLQKKTKESGIDLTFSHDFSVYSGDDLLRAWMIENLDKPLLKAIGGLMSANYPERLERAAKPAR